MPTHAIAWFEIPTSDIDRAAAFYGAIFGEPLQSMDMGGSPSYVFAADQDGGVGGALTSGDDNSPCATGSVVYLDAHGQLQEVLDRVEPAGGQVVLPRTDIGNDFGFFAFFMDTEGNRVGLYEAAGM